MARLENGIDRSGKEHSKINQVYERFRGNSCLITIRDALNPQDKVILKLKLKAQKRVIFHFTIGLPFLTFNLLQFLRTISTTTVKLYL